MKLDLNQDLDNYEQVRRWENSKRGRELYKLPKEVIPCINQLLITPIEEGNHRSKTGLYIAVDLRRCDIPEDKIEKILRHWNLSNIPPLPDKEIRGILKQSDKRNTEGDYKYSPGCNKQPFLDLCVGKDSCNYYLKNFKGKRTTEPNYLGMGWQYVLTSREREILFYVLPKIEKNRKLFKGNPIIITVRQLHHYTGISQRYFKEILTSLTNYGLITYEPGSPQVWKQEATMIRRSIPAPEIPKRYGEEENYKEYKQVMKERLNAKKTSDNISKTRSKESPEIRKL